MSKNTTQHSVSIPDAGEKSNAAVEPPVMPTTIPTPTAPKIETAPNPFDPARFRLSQHNLAAGSVKKQLTIIPVRKPSKEQFVRCHPDQAFRIETLVLELKDDREIYLIEPSLWSALDGESTISPRLLITSQTKQGTIFLWPIRLPVSDGRLDDWNRSAMEAATLATGTWVQKGKERCRVPTLEAALTNKYGAMLSVARNPGKRGIDGVDFFFMVQHSLEEGRQPIDLELLEKLGEKVWPGGGGKEILHCVDLAKGGQVPRLLETQPKILEEPDERE